jgi:hypothetical protein
MMIDSQYRSFKDLLVCVALGVDMVKFHTDFRVLREFEATFRRTVFSRREQLGLG